MCWFFSLHSHPVSLCTNLLFLTWCFSPPCGLESTIKGQLTIWSHSEDSCLTQSMHTPVLQEVVSVTAPILTCGKVKFSFLSWRNLGDRSAVKLSLLYQRENHIDPPLKMKLLLVIHSTISLMLSCKHNFSSTTDWNVHQSKSFNGIEVEFVMTDSYSFNTIHMSPNIIQVFTDSLVLIFFGEVVVHSCIWITRSFTLSG